MNKSLFFKAIIIQICDFKDLGWKLKNKLISTLKFEVDNNYCSTRNSHIWGQKRCDSLSKCDYFGDCDYFGNYDYFGDCDYLGN